jgi:hypothetical protein
LDLLPSSSWLTSLQLNNTLIFRFPSLLLPITVVFSFRPIRSSLRSNSTTLAIRNSHSNLLQINFLFNLVNLPMRKFRSNATEFSTCSDSCTCWS